MDQASVERRSAILIVSRTGLCLELLHAE